MKIFVTKKNPSTNFIYKVLFFIRSRCSEEEFLFYINEVLNYEGHWACPGQPKVKFPHYILYHMSWQ